MLLYVFIIIIRYLALWLCCMGCTSSSAFGMKNLSNGIQGLVWKVTLVDLGIRCILLEKLYSVSFSPMQKFFCSGNKIKLLRGPKEENRVYFTRPHFKNIINELPYLKFPQHFFSSVGKTSLITRFMYDHFETNYQVCNFFFEYTVYLWFYKQVNFT